jgi:hypothetical protein
MNKQVVALAIELALSSIYATRTMASHFMAMLRTHAALLATGSPVLVARALVRNHSKAF